jgi:hypothetical protein
MSSTLPDNWLDQAAACGSTKWLKQFIRSYLPQLKQQAIAPQEFEQSLTEELEARRLMSPAQQKNYRSNVVQAIKIMDPNHPAIALVGLSTEQYRELNDQQRGVLAERETQYLTHDQVDQLVEKATALLESSEWADVAAGLAVLIGRRISEILLSEFELKTAWSLTFSGMAKKTNADGVTIEIPTLAPANRVIEAIRKLQQGLKIDDLKLNALSEREAKRQVNARYSGQVSKRVELHFSGLVPPRTGKDDLYTHIFRAVYAAIASFWFCPINIPPHKFKAEIQGHFKLTSDGRKLPNYAARSNYDDYAIADANGNRDGRLGIMLGTLSGLELLEVFKKGGNMILDDDQAHYQDHDQADDQADDQTGDHSSIEEGDRSTVTHTPHLTPLAPAAISSSPDPQSADGDGTSTIGSGGPQLDDSVPPPDVPTLVIERPSANAIRYRAASLLAKARVSQAERLVALQILSGLSTQQLMDAQLKAISPFVLEVDGVSVTTLVQGLLSPIVKFRQQGSLPSKPEVQRVCEATFDRLPVLPNQLHLVYLAISHIDDPMPASPKPPTKRPSLRSADLDRLTKVMAHLGVFGHDADLFSALLDAFEQGQHLSQQQQAQSLDDVAATLKWMTEQIDSLKSQVSHLQQERDSLQLKLASAQDSSLLVNENKQLKAQLLSTQAKLEQIQSFIAGRPSPPTELSLSPIPTSAQSLTPPKKSPHPKSTRSPSPETEAIINIIIQAVFHWNHTQTDPKQKIRISFGSLKDIGKPLGATYQKAIESAIKNNQQAIDEHHANHLLGLRHNSSVDGYEQVVEAIAHSVQETLISPG